MALKPASWQSPLTFFRNAVEDLHWRPGRDVLTAFGSYVLVVLGLYTAFQIITVQAWLPNFLMYGVVTLLGFGVVVPVLYTKLVRHASLADIGITSQFAVSSLILGLILGFDTYRNTIATLPVAWTPALVPLITLALSVGLFEAIFFRGWLQLRFEAAFGIVPGLVLSALCYSLYHIGYGMTANEMFMLFGYGLVFGAVFRLTRNILVLWPFYTVMGGLYANLGDGLSLPFEATYGFVWVILLMLAVTIFAQRLPTRTTIIQQSS